MPGCVFHAVGKDFDVDAFVANSSLQPYEVYHRGEKLLRSRPAYENAGLKVDVSQADGCLAVEFQDAIRWLTENMAELERLAAFPGVESMALDFGYNLRSEFVVQSDSVPLELMRLAVQANVSLDLTLYSWVSEQAEESQSV